MPETNSRTSLGLLCSLTLVALAVGLAGGFIAGHLKGKAINSMETVEAKDAAEQAKALQREAESNASLLKDKLTNAKEASERTINGLKSELLIAKQEAVDLRMAMAKSKDTEKKISPIAKKKYDNDKLLDFNDHPEKYLGEKLTFAMVYDPFDIHNKLESDTLSGVTRFKAKVGGNNTEVRLLIYLNKGLEVPKASFGNSLIVTVQPFRGNAGAIIFDALKIERP